VVSPKECCSSSSFLMCIYNATLPRKVTPVCELDDIGRRATCRPRGPAHFLPISTRTNCRLRDRQGEVGSVLSSHQVLLIRCTLLLPSSSSRADLKITQIRSHSYRAVPVASTTPLDGHQLRAHPRPLPSPLRYCPGKDTAAVALSGVSGQPSTVYHPSELVQLEHRPDRRLQ